MFEEKDRVYDILFGSGIVERIEGENVICSFETDPESEYTFDQKGRISKFAKRSLYFKPFDIVIPDEATIKPKWRAGYNQTYFFINSFGDVESQQELGNTGDNARFMKRNYFRNESSARESEIYRVMNLGDD